MREWAVVRYNITELSPLCLKESFVKHASILNSN